MEKREMLYRQEAEISDREMIKDVTEEVTKLKKRVDSLEDKANIIGNLMMPVLDSMKEFFSSLITKF